MAKKKYNWEKIKAEYELGKTQGYLVKKYDVPHSTLSTRIKKNNWIVSEVEVEAIKGFSDATINTCFLKSTIKEAQDNLGKVSNHNEALKELSKLYTMSKLDGGIFLNNIYSNKPMHYGTREANMYLAKKYNFGYVYIIKGTHNGEASFKIGKANSLKNRLKKFDVKIPFDIELVMSFLVNTPLIYESKLHSDYSNKRLAGEWFNLDSEDLVSILFSGLDREISDMDDIHAVEKKARKKDIYSNKDEYIEYLETMLIMNSIDFKGWD